VLLVGDHQHVDEIATVLQRATYLGYHVIGVLSPTPADEQTPGGLPVLGSLDDILPALQVTAAQAVIFTDGALPSGSAFNRLAASSRTRTLSSSSSRGSLTCRRRG